MLAPKTTPGKWEVTGATKVVIFGEGYASIAEVCSPRPLDEPRVAHGHIMEPADFCNPRFHESCANATLIAAAPQLAEALNALVVEFDTSTHPHDLWLRAREALTAAGYTEEGE